MQTIVRALPALFRGRWISWLDDFECRYTVEGDVIGGIVVPAFGQVVAYIQLKTDDSFSHMRYW